VDGGLHWTIRDVAVLFQFVGHGVVALPRCLYYQGLGGDYRWCWRKVTLISWRYGLSCDISPWDGDLCR
jgi:hypothetical protein